MSNSGTSTCTIRPAVDADLLAVTSIYAASVLNGTASFELEPPDLAEMRRRWLDVTNRGLPYLVAGASGEVIGFAYAGPYRPRPAYRFTVEDSIYVREDRAGRGVGRGLLAALIDAAERSGARQMIAVIGDTRNATSIALHRGQGFVDAGALRDVGWKLGRWLDIVLMQRALGAGSANAPDRAPGE
jgi:L-amino acid N-acyltransferase YncA